VASPIEHMEQLISSGNSENSNIIYLKDKVSFYIYFSQEIQHLESDSEVLVTSFDKTPNLSYDTGEDKHIEALMETWSKKILSGDITVRQIAHVFTKKDLSEAKERMKKFKDCFNYSLSIMVGMPIRPYIDFVVINGNTVLLGFPQDKSAPYDMAFGIAIRGANYASAFGKYFNIYWNDECIPLKTKDGSVEKNISKIDSFTLNVSNFSEYSMYNQLVMKLIDSSAPYKNLNKLIARLHMLTVVGSYGHAKKIAADKLNKFYNDVEKFFIDPIRINANQVQDIMRTTIACAQNQIRATSVEIGDDSYWTSKDGEEIFSLNISGIAAKQIIIDRIFIMYESQQESLAETLAQQRIAGVNAYKIVTSINGRGPFNDFIIIDNDVVMELLISGTANMYINADKISEYVEKFTTYQQQATCV
jgi:hypothetical protein